MAERWQQWMPFHIDRWRGSMHVQAMRAAARMGYLYLLAAAWQSDDCSLRDDDEELQIRAALDDEEWKENSATILRRFTKREDGRLVNDVLLSEWKRAEEKFKTNQARAEATNRKRATNAGRMPHEREAHALTGTGTGTLTGTSTETEKTFASTADAVPAGSSVSSDRGALLDTLPLNDGTHYEVREDDLARDNPLYPGVDVAQAYRAMKAYLLANPRRAKTRGGIRRFMNNWLSRSQNSVRGVAAPARLDAAMGSVRPQRDEAAEAEEEAARREAALSYWREMKALGRPIYAREAPRWAREVLENVVSSPLPVLSCFQTDN